MNEDSRWTLLAALLPPSYDLQQKNEDEAILSNEEKSVKLIYNKDDNTYIVDGITLHFQDTEEEVVYTLLVPYLLTLFDGEQRL